MVDWKKRLAEVRSIELTLRDEKYRLLNDVLVANLWCVSSASRALGLPRSTVWGWLRGNKELLRKFHCNRVALFDQDGQQRWRW